VSSSCSPTATPTDLGAMVCARSARRAILPPVVRKYEADPKPYIARVKKWQQENAERLNEYRREYRRRPERPRADRDGHLRRKYGIGIDDFEEILVEQRGACAICRAPSPAEDSLHVDHDHTSGRSVACSACHATTHSGPSANRWTSSSGRPTIWIVMTCSRRSYGSGPVL
jgi:hypothetical protein